MITCDKKYCDWCMRCWNYAIDCGELIYKKHDAESFDSFFFGNGPCSQYFGVYEDEGVPCGFASGDYCSDSGIGYITFVYVTPMMRRRGIGSALLHYIEDKIRAEAGDSLKRIDMMFINPMHIAWHIPGHTPHDHPCAPGVDMSGIGYLFAKNVGYRDYATQNSYYMPLEGYTLPSDIASKESALLERGIEITYFDTAKHIGFPEFFDALKNEGWRKQVLSNLDKPVLVAVKDNIVIGYTGPLSVDPSGRGNFCGIGVHPDMRGGGTGKVLFCRLCEGLKNIGATFMSLYTGEENPARNIYEAAGFKIVRSWSCMRKAKL